MQYLFLTLSIICFMGGILNFSSFLEAKKDDYNSRMFTYQINQIDVLTIKYNKDGWYDLHIIDKNKIKTTASVRSNLTK